MFSNKISTGSLTIIQSILNTYQIKNVKCYSIQLSLIHSRRRKSNNPWETVLHVNGYTKAQINIQVFKSKLSKHWFYNRTFFFIIIYVGWKHHFWVISLLSKWNNFSLIFILIFFFYFPFIILSLSRSSISFINGVTPIQLQNRTNLQQWRFPRNKNQLATLLAT